MCTSGECIDQSMRCNREYNCQDGSDENDCGKSGHNVSQNKCITISSTPVYHNVSVSIVHHNDFMHCYLCICLKYVSCHNVQNQCITKSSNFILECFFPV